MSLAAIDGGAFAMTQACSLWHGHSLDLETVKRESLVDPCYGFEMQFAFLFLGGFYRQPANLHKTE